MVTLTTQNQPDEQNRPKVSGIDADSKLKEIIAASGISARLWRLYAYFWLVCLFFPILYLIQTPPSGLHLLITITGLITGEALSTSDGPGFQVKTEIL